ncbi:GntR family transcriptional regulator [Virgibacillus sp. W0430]|uniref:GntR family transcriptional regulator n=1 Tax=Virgibacillus sp. W0430 TaxID=3391580 RepID=UPI003F477C01
MRKKQSVEQTVYETLNEAILSRELAPGKQLVETAISSQLNVSRTPVRNAIRKLAVNGLVNIYPNRGAFVASPSKEEIIQAFDLRKDLETMAAIKALHHLNEKEFNRMRLFLQEEEDALKKKSLVDYLNANKKFHMVIAQNSGNKFLAEFIERLINQTNIYLILYDSFFENTTTPPVSPLEHQEILQLLQAKKSTELEQSLHHHYKHAIDSLSIHENEYKEIHDLF